MEDNKFEQIRDAILDLAHLHRLLADKLTTLEYLLGQDEEASNVVHITVDPNKK